MERNIKRFLSLVLAFVMVFGMMPMNVFATGTEPAEETLAVGEPVAKIGDVPYSTFADAIAAVQNGETIELLADISDDVTITQKANVAFTIDGAGHIYTGTISISGTGKATNAGQGLTIKNINFNVDGYAIYTGGKTYPRNLTVDGCSFTGVEGGSADFGIYLRYSYNTVVKNSTADKMAYMLSSATAMTGFVAESVTIKNSANGIRLAYVNSTALLKNVIIENGGVGVEVLNNTKGTVTFEDCSIEADTNLKLTQVGTNTAVVSVNFEGDNTMICTGENWLENGNDACFLVEYNGDEDAEEDVTIVIPVPDVAEVNGVGYTTLGEAIAAANAGDTITLLADITEDVTVNKSVTINGADFDYTGKMVIKSDAVNVTIENVDFVKGYIYDNEGDKLGYLTVKNCDFDGVDKTIDYAIRYERCNKLVMENCTAKNYKTGALYLPGETDVVEVKDVVIENVAAAFNITYCNTGTFENVKVSNATYGIHSPNYGNRTFTLKGCDFDSPNPVYVPKKTETEVVTVVIEGDQNIFSNNIAYSSRFTKFVLNEGAVLTANEVIDAEMISGVEGLEVIYENGAYKLGIKKAYVAQIGEQGYETLTAAIAAATAGQTITLLADITEDVTVNKSVTIDGAGKTYTGKMNLTSGTTTIKNVNFDGKGYDGYAVETRGASSLTIEGCTAKNYGFGFVQIVKNCKLTAKNVTVENVNYGFKINYSNGVTMENVTVMDAAYYGIYDSNYAAKTYTIKDCNISSIEIFQRNTTYSTTFKFVGANTVGTLTDSQFAKYVLTEESATLTAPEGADVTTTVEGLDVLYEDGTYKLGIKKTYVARIGEQDYETLTAAIAAATSGQTITLLADINENVSVDKNITIEGAEFNYTGTMNITKGISLTVQNLNFVSGKILKGKNTGTNANLTLKKCNFDGQGLNAYAVELRDSKNIVIEDCTAKSYGYGFLQLPKSNVSLSVKNVDISDVNYGFKIDYSNGVTMENVTVMGAAYYGIYDSNYAAKTYTIKDCNISSIEIWERNTTNSTTFKFEGANTVGTLTDSQFAKYVLTEESATLTAPEGADVTTSVAEHKVVYEGNLYKVAKMNPVAQIGDKKFESIQEAVKAAVDGDTITVIADHELVWDGETKIDGSLASMVVVAGKSVTIDLNGKKLTVDGAKMNGTDLYAVFAADEGGSLTLTGNGTVEATGTAFAASGTTAYCLMMAYEAGTNLVVENGTYTMEAAHDSLIYSGGNECVTIIDGNFTLGNVGNGQNGKPWIFNCYGANVQHVIVKGGTYNSDVSNQHWKAEVYIPDGFICVDNGDGTWTVRPGKWIAEIKETGKKYEDLSDTIAMVTTGQTVILLADTAEDLVLVPAGVKLDLNGFVVTADNVLSFGVVMDTATEVGGIAISNDTTKAFTKLQPENDGYMPMYDSRDGMYKFFEIVYENLSYKAANDEVKFGVRIKFTNPAGYDVMANLDAENAGIAFSSTIWWTGLKDNVSYVVSYTSDDIKKYAKAAIDNPNAFTKAFTAYVGGYTSLDAGSLVSSAFAITSVTGFAYEPDAEVFNIQ